MNRILPAVLAATLLTTTSATAALIGDEITFSTVYFGSTTNQTGTVGTDVFAAIISNNANTRFDPVFTDTSIELGFSTAFPTGAWAFTSASVTFSGLDWDGAGILTGVSLFETVSDSDFTPADVSFTSTSVTVNLNDVLLRNGETIRLDLTPAHTPAVPLPAGGLLLLTAGGLLAGVSGRRWRRQPRA